MIDTPDEISFRTGGARRYRIAQLITRLELGGAQQIALYMAEHLDRERFDVSLLAGAGGLLDGEARRLLGDRAVPLPWLRHPIAPAADLVALVRLRNLFRSRAFDVVHTHSSKAGILGRLAAHLAGVPVVVHTVHGWSFNDTQPWPVRWGYVALERLVAPLTDRLLVVAERHARKGLDAGIGHSRQYAVARAGIDPTLYERSLPARERLRGELGYGAADVVVGNIGNFKPQKAPLDFVAAAAAAHRADPRLRFFMAGDGPLFGDVEKEIERLRLTDKIRLLGWRDDVRALLSAADVFLLTSLFEGLPRVVLQAMAAELPVVATAVDGTPEVVEDGVTGLLAPASDTEAQARQVARLAADEPLRRRLARAARDRLSAEFDIRKMVRDLDEMYVELLKSK